MVLCMVERVPLSHEQSNNQSASSTDAWPAEALPLRSDTFEIAHVALPRRRISIRPALRLGASVRRSYSSQVSQEPRRSRCVCHSTAFTQFRRMRPAVCCQLVTVVRARYQELGPFTASDIGTLRKTRLLSAHEKVGICRVSCTGRARKPRSYHCDQNRCTFALELHKI